MDGGSTSVTVNKEQQVIIVDKTWGEDGDQTHIEVNVTTSVATMTETPSGQAADGPHTAEAGKPLTVGKTTFTFNGVGQEISLSHGSDADTAKVTNISGNGNVTYTNKGTYKEGYDAGVADAQAGKDALTADEQTGKTQDYIDGYNAGYDTTQGTTDGALAGVTGASTMPDVSDKSQSYQTAYKVAFDQAVSEYKSGYTAGQADGKAGNVAADNTEQTTAYQNGYNAGFVDGDFTQYKETAKDTLEKAAAAVQTAITNDHSLLSADKTTQTAKVDPALKTLEEQIDAAKDKDAIDKIVTDGTTTLSAIHEPNKEDLDAQKTAAITALTNAAAATKTIIDGDDTLTTAEKQNQDGVVDAALNTGLDNVDAATDADGVSSALDNGTQSFDGLHQEGLPLDQQRTNATTTLTNTAESIKTKIANDVTLTADEQDTQTGNVDTELTAEKTLVDGAGDADVNLTTTQKTAEKANVVTELTTAKDNVNAAGNADGVTGAQSAGDVAINAAHSVDVSLADQKTNAIAELEKTNADVTIEINGDDTLLTIEKTAQLDKLGKALDNAKAAINGAADADEVVTALCNGKSTLEVHIAGDDVATQKANAKQALQGAATEATNAATVDPTLSAEEKAQQTDAIAEALNKALVAVDNANVADDINTAKTEGVAAIDGAHKPGQDLGAQKDDVKNQLDDAAAIVDKAIDADDTLTADVKKKQHADVAGALSDAKDAVDAAEDKDEIIGALSDGTQAIQNSHVGQNLDAQKLDTKQSLENVAEVTKGKIEADVTLTKQSKADQESAVDKALKTAGDAIDATTNADDIVSVNVANEPVITGVYQSGDTIAEQQVAANEKLEEAATAAKTTITEDPTLDGTTKTAQTKAVDDAHSEAEIAVAEAKTADDINTAVTAGEGEINDVHTPGDSIDDRQAAAAAAKTTITEDPTLDGATKTAQTAKVDDALSAAEAAVSEAKTADDINTAVTAGEDEINGVHTSGDSIDDRQAAAKQTLEAAATAAKTTITEDPTIDGTAKTAQTKAVDDALSAAEAAIAKAGTADDVNEAKVTGSDTISKAHVPGADVADQQADANHTLVGIVDTVKTAIDADETLTNQERSEQIQQVADALAKAEAEVDAAANTTDISTAVVNGTQLLNRIHVSGTALDLQTTVYEDADGNVMRVVTNGNGKVMVSRQLQL